METIFNFIPLLKLDDKVPAKFWILKSDFTSCKATIEVVAKYDFSHQIRMYRFVFYLFNLPSSSPSGFQVMLSKFSKTLIPDSANDIVEGIIASI